MIDEEELPRWIEIPAGLFILFFGLLCLIGSFAAIVKPTEGHVMSNVIAGVIMTALTVWILDKGWRMLLHRKPAGGGLLSPLALKVFAYVFLVLPVAGLFTGYYQKAGIRAVGQAAVYVVIFFGVRSLALQRERAATAEPPRPAAPPRPEPPPA